ncbi:HEAT repeat domain-containing protein [Synoicihabitans lomoniglobus]|uniref:HEAT repeat domain-containing protein n=1 Tax=Synoicihabitans lomoniglobus TaxID=2909285 RepID=A0AAF0CN76_9BACT|nr:HEAT repeat domain-containing protein [Opitutaceae bacterium LMO-M01]WED65148.1 HEAT repeat domain-containing protein [Opitutaceae bacterium LMO-M01]
MLPANPEAPRGHTVRLAPGLSVHSEPHSPAPEFDACSDAQSVWFSRDASLWQRSAEANQPTEILRISGSAPADVFPLLTGPVLGPDRLLYFATPPQAVRLTRADGFALELPPAGTVIRVRPDGSNPELVATGLRAPTALAFDGFGRLWVADQMASSAPTTHLVEIMEGTDYGWRSDQPSDLSESLRTSLTEFNLPAIGSLSGHVVGMTFQPGGGFTRNPTNADGPVLFVAFTHRLPGASGIDAYQLNGDGAILIGRPTPILRGVMPRALTFTPDGRLHVAGASPHSCISIASAEPAIATKPTLSLASAPLSELARLLRHRHPCQRSAAQHELSRRGHAALPTLRLIATDSTLSATPRFHALWAMAGCADEIAGALNDLPRLLRDQDLEIRAQAARLVGDQFRIEAYPALLPLLRDEDSDVVFFAAQSLGKLKRPEAASALIDLLHRNDNQDSRLRHAAVGALTRLNHPESLKLMVEAQSRAVRLGGALVLRRLRDPMLADLLDDFDPLVVRAAASAINDTAIDEALPALAATLFSAPLDDEALVVRAINAHFLLGAPENAAALAKFAGLPYVPARLRAEALEQLGRWATPPQRDRISGQPRTLAPRDPAPAKEAITGFLHQLSGNAPELVQIASIHAVATLHLGGTGHALWDVVYQSDHPVRTRIAALQALETTNDLRLEVAAQTAGRSHHPALRLAALPILARRHPGVSLPTIEFLVANGTLRERREAFAVLATMDDERADTLLHQALQEMLDGLQPAAAQVELLEAAAMRSDPEVLRLGAALEAELATRALPGGSVSAGRAIAEGDSVAACSSCHELSDTSDSNLFPVGGPARLAALPHHPLPGGTNLASELTLRQRRDVTAWLASLQANAPPAEAALVTHALTPSAPE